MSTNMFVCLCLSSLLFVVFCLSVFLPVCVCVFLYAHICVSFFLFFLSELLFMSNVLFLTHFPFSLCLSPSVYPSPSLSQSKADGDVLDYKQLAALPRVKAIYGVQRPDIIPYQADHAHTHLSDDTLERYSCGQVHTHTHTHNQ